VFYVSFDGHANAEITPADPRPQGNPAWVELVTNVPPTELYPPGVFGRGMRSGAQQLSYLCTNAVLGSTGAMALWLKPVTLNHKATYCWPAQIHAIGSGYTVMFGRMGHPANREILYAYLGAGKSGVSAVNYTGMANWQPGRWHVWVVNWDRHGVEFSADGATPIRSSLKAPLGTGAGGFRASLLSPNEDTFVYDEFMLFDVPLTPDEIAWLYREGAGGQKEATP
jgi:hypothetical protein